MSGLSILNVGSGDTRISFDPDKPEERKRACQIVMDMLKRGYAILVEAGEKDGKKLYHRATAFDPETAEYIVAGLPEEAIEASERVPVVKKKGRGRPRRLPAASTPAVSVARSAGGMSDRADSVEMENLRRFDNFAQLRHQIGVLAEIRDEWAGMPMPLDDCPLIVEPRYPRAQALMAFGRAERPDSPADLEPTMRNRFYSTHKRCDVIIWNKGIGVEWGIHSAIHSLDNQIQTMGASVAWGIEQEANALQLLAGLLPHHAFKKYLLTGAFIESSERSGVSYIFRKLRPTVAITQRMGELRILAVLCMHPIAYYQGSWSGAMTPTDDVIAHLMLMRGAEPLYWRRCNQHPAYRPEAGL
jgi:hypothetical protein